MRYRRSMVLGGTYFFTVNLAIRSQDTLVKHAELLRHVFRTVRARHPFDIIAMVVLPDHLHAIWQLPLTDADYCLRLSLIKSGFSRSMPKIERISDARHRERERGIWQRRYWSIKYATTVISKPMWTIFITTRSSTGKLPVRWIGHTRQFIGILR